MPYSSPVVLSLIPDSKANFMLHVEALRFSACVLLNSRMAVGVGWVHLRVRGTRHYS